MRCPVDIVSEDKANAILDGAHYLGAVDFRPRFCMATPSGDATAIFSDPIAASFATNFDHPLELARLWRAGDAPFVTSEFLAACLRRLRKIASEVDCVFTYADSAAGHNGGIYHATNFTFVRKTRAIDQWQTSRGEVISAAKVYRELKTKDPVAILSARPDWKRIPGGHKKLFVYPMRLSVASVLEKLSTKMPEARRAMYSRAHSGFKVSIYQDKFPPLKCGHCGRQFLARRADAVTCSPKCRTALYRKRRA